MKPRLGANERKIVRDVPLKKHFFFGNSPMQHLLEYLESIMMKNRDDFRKKFTSVFKDELSALTYHPEIYIEKAFYVLYPDWKFFNGVRQLYYGYFNDGDQPHDAWKNNRVAFYDSPNAMIRDEYATAVGTLERALKYPYETISDGEMEAVMNAVVYYYTNDSKLKLLREKRASAEQIKACAVCGQADAKFRTIDPSDGKRYCGKRCFDKEYPVK